MHAPKGPRTTRLGVRRWLAGVALLASLLPACTSGGNFSILGYSTSANFDTSIRTVRVPIFKNRTFRLGIEKDVTQAIINEIEQKTPYKVVHACAPADTELLGTVVSFEKSYLLANFANYHRAMETRLTVAVEWKDLRTGEVLSRRARRQGDPFPQDVLLGDNSAVPPGMPVPPSAPDNPIILPEVPPPVPEASLPIRLTSVAVFHPELGQSETTAIHQNAEKIASLVRGMMESPW